MAPPTMNPLPRQPLPQPNPSPIAARAAAADPDADPLPLALPTPLAAAHALAERQNIVTLQITASTNNTNADTSSSSSSGSKGFPVAVAIPALVGGMVAACAAFALWYFMSKRKARKRRERWEAAQRRKRRRAGSNTNGRPSVSSSRNPSHTNLRGLAEKDEVPPVPMLPKMNSTGNYHPQPSYQPDSYAEKQSYGGTTFNAYAQQPPIDQYGEHQATSPTYSGESASTGEQSAESTTPLNPSGAGYEPSLTAAAASDAASSLPPPKPSRSAARVAAAENAAMREGMDPNVRYQPKKPSPLALKAAQEKAAAAAAAAAAAGGGQEMLAPEGYYSSGAGATGRQVSGEWGVALGSPNHDPSVSFSQQQQQQSISSRYSNDPYLTANRAPSGQYSTDPYAGYHDPVANDVAGGKKKSNWV